MSHPSATVRDVMDTPDEQAERREGRRLATQAALVIDPRLADLWQLIWGRHDESYDGVPLATLAALLRLAYAQGYTDAQGEEPAGSLYRELGLRTATRPRSARRSRPGRAASGNSDT
jgi:hypothetical protein